MPSLVADLIGLTIQLAISVIQSYNIIIPFIFVSPKGGYCDKAVEKNQDYNLRPWLWRGAKAKDTRVL
jgi:hypothetical protein